MLKWILLSCANVTVYLMYLHKLADLSRAISRKWKEISKKEKEHWQKIADEDKERYNKEKAAFQGPWTCLKPKKVKDIRAPKRSSSAFLLFCSANREGIKNAQKGIRMAELSSILGKKWREMSSSEKKPYVDMEKIGRDKYLAEVAAWKEKIKNEHKSFDHDISASYDGKVPASTQSRNTQNLSKTTNQNSFGYFERCNLNQVPMTFATFEYNIGSGHTRSPVSSTEYLFKADEMQSIFPALPELDRFPLFATDIFDETKDPMLNI